jgi:hypothetical protein
MKDPNENGSANRLHDDTDGALPGFPQRVNRISSTHLSDEVLKYLRDMPIAFGRCFVKG